MVLVRRCARGLGLVACLVEVMISNYTINSMFKTMDTVNILPFDDYAVFYATSYVPAFALLVLAVFTCVAILRYKLCDIDVLINRTFVFGALSACVVGIYVLAVVARSPLPGAGQPRRFSDSYRSGCRPLPSSSSPYGAGCSAASIA